MELVERDLMPMQTLHIDHFGPLESKRNKFKYILVVVEAFSRFVWLFPTKTTNTAEVIKHLNTIFSFFGYPKRIISDRETAFTSNDFAQFMKENNITHVKVAVASPWANGIAERVNRFLKSTLAKLTEDPSD